MEVHRNGAMNMKHRKPRPKPGDVTVMRVDPLTWQTAIDLAGGDFARIEIVNRDTVIVHNRPHIWRHPFRRARSVISATKAEGQEMLLFDWTTEPDKTD